MATKQPKLETISGLDPLTKYKRSAFVAGGKGDELWREQQTVYACALRDHILAEADHTIDIWREARMAKAAEKATKLAAKLRAKADALEAVAKSQE
jgi:hypothetical protein